MLPTFRFNESGNYKISVEIAALFIPIGPVFANFGATVTTTNLFLHSLGEHLHSAQAQLIVNFVSHLCVRIFVKVIETLCCIIQMDKLYHNNQLGRH
jgi:hypothetical protein